MLRSFAPFLLAIGLIFSISTAHARSLQPVPAPTPPPSAPIKANIAPKAMFLGSIDYFKYGIGIRGGMLFIPEFFLNGLFFSESSGVINGGFQVEFILRSAGDFEYAFGAGWHNLTFANGTDSKGSPIPHIFLNKGDSPSEREIVDNSLSYIALDVRFIKHFPFHRHVSFFLGGGIGLGITLGQITRTDTFPTGASYENWKKDPVNNPAPAIRCPAGCKLNTSMPDNKNIDDGGRREGRVPPVLPILDLILGFSFPIHERFDVRVMGGVGAPKLFWWSLAMHVFF